MNSLHNIENKFIKLINNLRLIKFFKNQTLYSLLPWHSENITINNAYNNNN